MKNYFKNVSIVLATLILVACSKSPSNEELQIAFDDYAIINSKDGLFEIKNIKKTNGYMLDGYYVSEIEFERHFLVGLDDFIEMANSEIKEEKPKDAVGKLTKGLFGMMSGTGFMRMALVKEYGEFEKGDISEMIHKIYFINTENGWQMYTE
ncbi:hypothetical protein SAMN05216262_1426 [Colwellia chukchiensis]|uniref:Lipoprotein n=1 Tax=Colwellia chukchiensis TaxID=641665 RepID=A0A1H7UHA7_9GAMM|nr:hypothetical protein [Colwellia chukchiensis]SEL96038.1 hypothetical protein SAMN05216262_1426 [Colwellia chukchiensis]